MKNVIRVALPGYNAETDTNPDHFALYSDKDWVLIKEWGRGSNTVLYPNSILAFVNHKLGYHPFYMDFFYYIASDDPNVVLGKWKSASISEGLPGRAVHSGGGWPAVYIGTGYIQFSGIGTHKWYVFYDKEET